MDDQSPIIRDIDEYLDGVDHHPVLEQVVDIVTARIQNDDRPFFRNLAIYHMGVCASSMRASVDSEVFGQSPVNVFNIALGSSGVGKGFCTRLMEDHIMKGFRKRFLDVTMPELREQNVNRMASSRAGRKGTEEDAEIELLEKQIRECGAYQFAFDGGHESAIKQLRQGIQIANCGALNLVVDEIGSNLEKSADPMKVYLELYDRGQIKDKLLKNSADNTRYDPLDQDTPANALLFGAPDDIFAGGPTEDNFYNFLRNGYGRRTLFALAREQDAQEDADIVGLYDEMANHLQQFVNTPLVDIFTDLADTSRINWTISMPRSVGIQCLAYKKHCEFRAKKMGHNQGDHIGPTEMRHRHSRAIKIAGIYAFVDGASTMLETHFKAAVKLMEESGNAFGKILNRPMAHQRLAHYIADSETSLTYAEMREQLPYMPKTMGGTKEIMTLATAYGYKNNIVIKKTFDDGVDFFTGESLAETDLDGLIISHSDQMAKDYYVDLAPFDQLDMLAQAPNRHFCNHSFKANYRNKDNVLPGFNCIIFDVDGSISLEGACDLMKEFTFVAYTTKSHTEEVNRFRMIIPTNYKLEMSRPDYMEFMKAVHDWLPFKLDPGGSEPERKWRTNPHAKVVNNKTDQLFDVLPFIPKTTRNEEHMRRQEELKDLDSLERWVAQRWEEGGRNNVMLRYTMCLVDDGMDYDEVRKRTILFNNSMSTPLTEDELLNTVLKTAAQRMSVAA